MRSQCAARFDGGAVNVSAFARPRQRIDAAVNALIDQQCTRSTSAQRFGTRQNDNTWPNGADTFTAPSMPARAAARPIAGGPISPTCCSIRPSRPTNCAISANVETDACGLIRSSRCNTRMR